MKSLEIVNELINKLKGKPELEYWNGNKINCLFRNEKGAGLLTCSLLEKIKDDLEVLEIIRKKKVNLIFIEHRIRLVNLKKMTLKNALEGYNFANEPLTMEELLKLKQWLEENE